MMQIPGKLILFGEYAILKGGSALAIPLSSFSGVFTYSNCFSLKAIASNTTLLKYCDWLIQNEFPFCQFINLPQLKLDLQQKLWFHSSIPLNSGLGSSGALVAAILHKYGVPKQIPSNLSELKFFLGRMEGFFHGSSSGIDPLVCYLNKSVVITSGDQPMSISTSQVLYQSFLHPFLIPVRGKGETGNLVQLFLNNMHDSQYSFEFERTYIPVNNRLVSHVSVQKWDSFFLDLIELSRLQMHFFSKMLDASSLGFMQKGIESGDYVFKLCGSGGGGYLLGFAHNLEAVNALFPNRISL